MRKYQVELIDGKFHILGFPDAVKLIAIPPLLGDLPEQLADLALHRTDLQFAQECLEAISASLPPLIAEALWRSAIAHYCKCFGGSRSRSTRLLPETIFQAGLPIGAHNYFKHLRNKHIVHDENAWSQATPMAVLAPDGKQEKVEDVICLAITGETRSDDNMGNLKLLVANAISWVESQIDNLEKKIKTQLETEDYSVLLNQPEPKPYRAPKAEDVSERRQK